MAVVGAGALLVSVATTAAPSASAQVRVRRHVCRRAPVEACAALVGTAPIPYGTVASAMDMPASDGVPEYCSVQMEAVDDSEPGLPGDITIDLTVPDDNWNGQYMAEGGGVYAGDGSAGRRLRHVHH